MNSKNFIKFSLFSFIKPWRLSLNKSSNGQPLGFVTHASYSIKLREEFVEFCRRHQISAGLFFGDSSYIWINLDLEKIHYDIDRSYFVNCDDCDYEAQCSGWQPLLNAS